MARNRDDNMLEHGDIFFLFRPDVDEDDPAALDDVQRFHIVLRPEGGHRLRLLTIGRKRLPSVEDHERNWGFVDVVTTSAKKLEKELQEETYETQTRGKRRRPAVRPAGEGVYAISLEDGQMHLSYALELPEEPDEVQTALNIEPEASFALSVKNPEKGQPPGAGLRKGEKADYPRKLQEAFRDRRFDSEDVELLNYEGAEVLLVGARRNPQRRYDVELETDQPDYEHADIIRDLRMVKSRHPIEPLFEGKWD